MSKAAIFAFAASAAFGGVIGFVNNETGNSADWATSVAANSGTINNSIDFESHPLSALQSSFYSGLGVTMAGTGAYTVVNNGAGPGQPNTFTLPASNGEGAHAASHYVGLDTATDFTGEPERGTFTLSFAAPVLGVGLFTINLYSPASANPNTVTIAAYDGIGGTEICSAHFRTRTSIFRRTTCTSWKL